MAFSHFLSFSIFLAVLISLICIFLFVPFIFHRIKEIHIASASASTISLFRYFDTHTDLANMVQSRTSEIHSWFGEALYGDGLHANRLSPVNRIKSILFHPTFRRQRILTERMLLFVRLVFLPNRCIIGSSFAVSCSNRRQKKWKISGKKK